MDPCRMNPGGRDQTAASCQWLPGFNSSPAVLCGPAFCGALTGEPKVRPPLQQTPQLLMNRIATGDKPARTCNILQLPQLLGGWTLQSCFDSNYIIRLYSSYTIIIIYICDNSCNSPPVMGTYKNHPNTRQAPCNSWSVCGSCALHGSSEGSLTNGGPGDHGSNMVKLCRHCQIGGRV